LKKLCILLSFINLLSCSSLSFISSQQTSISFDDENQKTKEVSVEVSKPFYMWGLVPNEQVVEVDKVLSEKGFENVSNISIKEIKTNDKALWMFFTMGMYYPQSFRITGRMN